jgi:hypothetical protein
MVTNPKFGNGNGVDFAGMNPNIVADCGTGTQTGGYSTDNGITWKPFANQAGGTKIAVGADGSVFVWGQNYSNNNGSSWTACGGLPGGARVGSDRVNPNKFYAFSGGTLYASTNGAATFTAATTGLSGSGRACAVFGMEGEVWVAAGANLYHSKTSGTGATRVTTVSQVYSVGFGKAAPGNTYPAVYIIGTVGGIAGVFRSNDQGVSWTRVNDDQHQFGQMDNVAGDEDYYGRVYVTTQGRGVPYGEPATTQVSSTIPSIRHPMNDILFLGNKIVADVPHSLQLLDLQGRIIRKTMPVGNTVEMNLIGLKPGAYLARCGNATLVIGLPE